MSTLVGEEHSQRIGSEKDLAGYFQAFAKRKECFKIGLEAEFFVVDDRTGQAVPYQGKGGIHDLLAALANQFGYEKILEDGNIIALKRGEGMITLEPGGQMELSAPPVTNVFQIESQLGTFVSELKQIREKYPHRAWLGVGLHPFSKLEDISWVPKHRYQIMSEFLGARGSLAHHMMKRTCTNHINVDYLSEENAMATFRVALGLTSIVSAMFAKSSFAEGRPNGYKDYRIHIWNHTDPARSGLVLQLLRPGCTFHDYLEYVLEVPVMFIVRAGKWVSIPDMTFRQYLKSGYQDFRATLGDFELHLSCIFTEVRIKQYLEIRGADCQSAALIPAVAAFWKGILYDPVAREEAWKLVSHAKESDFLTLHQAIPKQGLGAQLAGKPIFPIASQLVELSCSSLAKQKVAQNALSECVFLDRIRQSIIHSQKSPGEILVEKWQSEFKQNPQKLIQYLNILES